MHNIIQEIKHDLENANREVKLESKAKVDDGTHVKDATEEESLRSRKNDYKAKLISLVIDDFRDAPFILDPQFMARLNILNLQTELAHLQSVVIDGTHHSSQGWLIVPNAAGLDLTRVENVLHRYSKFFSWSVRQRT